MPEAQPFGPDDYIEPPPPGFGGMGGPVGGPSDTFGVQPAPRASVALRSSPAPSGPPDEVVPSPGQQSQLPVTQVAYPVLGPGVDYSDEQPVLRTKIEAALDAMPPELRAQVKITSGFRTREQQEAAYQRYQTGQGGLAARPGMSRHESGAAFDFSASSPEADRAFRLASMQQGIVFPYAAQGDPGHGQLAGPSGMKPPSLQQVSGFISPELMSAHEQEVAAGNEARARIEQGKAEMERLIAAEPPGTAKRDKLIDEMHESIARHEAAWKEKYDHPPVLRPVDAFQNFGSIGTIVALIGGLFARRHMTAALGAAGRAMQAINQNNYDQFQQQMKVWETQTRSAAEELHMQHQDLEMLIRDKQMSWDQKQALIANKFREIGLDRDADAITLGNAHQWTNTIALMDRTQNSLKNQAGQMAIVNRTMAEQNWNQKFYADNPKMAGKPIPLDEQVKRTQYLDQNFPLPGAHPQTATQAKGREQEVSAEVARRDTAFAKSHPEATQDEKEKAHFENRTAVEKELSQSTKTPRSAPAMYMQKYMEENPGATSEELAEASAFYRRLQATESSFAGGVNGRNLMSLNTVAGHIIDVFQYADALHNGQIPRANAIANRIAQELGKSEVTSFEAGRDIMTGEVVRLLTATGGSVEDRNRMIELIGKSFSPEQFAGVERVFKEMIGDRLSGMEQGYARNDPKRRTEFETNMLTAKARLVFSQTVGGGAPVASPTAAAPPPITYSTAQDVTAAYKAGHITREEAAKILREHGWAQ